MKNEREKGRRGERGSWLAGALVLFVAWLLCVPTHAATVTNQFKTADYFNPNPEEALVLHWTPLFDPYVGPDGEVVTSAPFTTTLSSSGFLSNRVYAGCYTVTFGNSRREVWRPCVPTGEGFYSFWELATNTVGHSTNLNRPVVVGGTNVAGPGVAVFGTNRNGVLEFLRLRSANGNLTITSQGNTQVLFTATGGGGGGSMGLSTNGVEVDAAVSTWNFVDGILSKPVASTDGAGNVTVQLNVEASVTNRTASLEGQTNSLGARASSLEGQTNALGSRASSLEGQTNSLGARSTALESRATSIESQTNALGARTSSIEGQTNSLGARASSLEGQTNSLGARATSLEGQTNTLGTRVSALEAASSGGSSNMPVATVGTFFVTNAFYRGVTNLTGDTPDFRLAGPNWAWVSVTNNLLLNVVSPAAGVFGVEGYVFIVNTGAAHTVTFSNVTALNELVCLDATTSVFRVVFDRTNALVWSLQERTTGTGPVVLESRVITIEGQTNALGARVSSLEGQTNSLGLRASSLEGQTNALGARATSIESQTNSLGARASSLEGQTNALGLRASSLEGQTNALGARTTALESQTNLYQPASGVLTNLAGTGAITNVVGQITATFERQGSVVSAGTKTVQIPIEEGCTITDWRIYGDPSGSAVVEVWKDTSANSPPADADDITAAAKPTLSAQGYATGSASTWTSGGAVSAGDVIIFYVDSCSTITNLTVSLKTRRTP
jgi:hypothetical protein